MKPRDDPIYCQPKLVQRDHSLCIRSVGHSVATEKEFVTQLKIYLY